MNQPVCTDHTRKEVQQRFKNILMTGLDCGDGWMDIIWEALEKIEKNCTHVEFYQIKEKFGGLRMYGAGKGKIWDYVEEAERKSLKTCEGCGAPGHRTNIKGWIRTLCDQCEKEVA